MTESRANGEISYRNELVRKAIHLCSLSIPIIYHFIERGPALMLLVPVTIFALALDYGRFLHSGLGGMFHKAFGWLLREHESDSSKKRLNGATYVLISATVCVAVFPKVVMIPAFGVLVLGDLAAALIGRRFGRHKLFGKSWEGTLAFFAAGSLVMFLSPYAPAGNNGTILGLAAVAAGAFVEVLPWSVDDNFSIPLAVGAVLLFS